MTLFQWIRRMTTACFTLCVLWTSSAAMDSAPATASFTHQRADGNRLIGGKGALPSARVLDVQLQRAVAWIIGSAAGEGSHWVVVLEDGAVYEVELRDGAPPQVTELEPARSPGPPVMIETMGRAVLHQPSAGSSMLSHAIPLSRHGRLAFVSEGGGLMLSDRIGAARSILSLKLLPDARLLTDGRARILALTDPTTRYGHGVLGDAVEAASMTLVDTRGEPQVVSRIHFPMPWVFEGLAPIWVDWNDDGEREIVATLSSDAEGAKLVLFDESGEILAEGDAIGRGHRWRHAIAIAPFGPGGEMELVEVMTPHLGGIVQFFRWNGRRIQRVARVTGFTSHVYGSRNLDLVAAGDFDGDGRVELLLPAQERRFLGVIRRTDAGAALALSLPLPARVSSNIAGVTLADGKMTVAVGLEDGTLRIYAPQD